VRVDSNGVGTVTIRGAITVASNTASAISYDSTLTGSVTLVNDASGTLSSPVTAVEGSNADAKVTNSGTIRGRSPGCYWGLFGDLRAVIPVPSPSVSRRVT
jgi:hypothetical protein